MFCIAQSQAVADEFERANGASARATWSNGSRPAMEAVTMLNTDPARREAFRKEQDEFAASLQHRADIFMGEAAEAGLPTCPYKSGFFIYVPTPTHEQAVEISTSSPLKISTSFLSQRSAHRHLRHRTTTRSWAWLRSSKLPMTKL